MKRTLLSTVMLMFTAASAHGVLPSALPIGGYTDLTNPSPVSPIQERTTASRTPLRIQRANARCRQRHDCHRRKRRHRAQRR
jgi:hypothetical protein